MSLSPKPNNNQAGPLALLASFQIDAGMPAGETGAAPALPRFRMVAYTGGPMRIAGWRFPVIVDLAGLAIPSQNRPIRFGHDASAGAGVGHTDAISVEAGQLIATGLVSRDTPAAREIVVSSKNGFPWQASIGASVEEFEFVKDGQKTIVNGRTFEGPVNVVRKSTLGEISFVDLGADGNTSAQVAASQIDTANQKETATMDGVTQTHTSATSAPNTTAAASPAVGAPPVQATAVSTDTSVQNADHIRAEALAETNRIAAIRKICNPGAGQKHYADIEAQAIKDGWDQTKTELEVLRASRPKAPVAGNVAGAPMGFTIASHGPVTPALLEAACLLVAGLSKPEEHCDEQVLDAASKRFRHGISLQELMVEAAMVNGYVGRTFRSDPHTIMAMAFPSQQQIQAGFATIDIAPILSNVGNKFLLDGFFSVERTWRNICAIRSVTDFKTVTSYRLIGADQYELIAPGGELKHGTLGNEMYSNKADTYGLMLNIERRDIINDDLGAITTVPRKLGRGSGLKINDVFWTIFLNNAAIFAAANKNYLAGVGTGLGIDSLSNAVQAFNDQVDSDGKPISVDPKILLVPTSLSAMATQLYKSTEIRDTTSNTKTPIANPHQSTYRVEVSRYLGNARYAGASQKAWYLLADANDLPLIEVAFLNGNESPTIETIEANANVLGITVRGYHDFGVAMQDPRAGVKSKGEA